MIAHTAGRVSILLQGVAGVRPFCLAPPEANGIVATLQICMANYMHGISFHSDGTKKAE